MIYIRLNTLISLLWILVIAAFYFMLFPVFGIFSGLPVIHGFRFNFGAVEHIICLILFVISANGWGGILWSNKHLSHLERFVFAAGAGFGVMSLIVLLFNVLGVTNSSFYFIILIAGFVMFIATGKQIHGFYSHHLRILLLLSIVPLVSTLIGALAPPTQFDSLVYHLALPLKYLLAGKMYHVPDNMFFAFPQGLEMLFQMALKLDSDILANLLHWVFLPLTGLAVYAFGVKFWGHKQGIVSSIIWFTTPAVMLVSTGTYVDLAVAFYVFMSVYAFMFWRETNRAQFIYLCALFSGLACGVKYTAAANVLIIAALFLVFSRAHNSHRHESEALEDENAEPESQPPPAPHSGGSVFSGLKHSLQYAFIALLVFAPWLLKNYVYLNNPLAPWGAGIFTASAVSAQQAGRYFSHIASHGTVSGGIADIIRLPWDITFSGIKFGGGFDILGPVFLIFIPVLFLRMKIDKMDKILYLFTLAYVIIWVATGRVMRFLIPAMPFMCIFSAKGVLYLAEEVDYGRIFRNVVYTFLAVLLIHNLLLFHWVMASVDPYSYVIGGLTRQQYLEKKVNYFLAASLKLNRLGSSSKTLFIGETRSFYCTGHVIAPTDFDVNPFIAKANSLDSPDALLKFAKQEKLTHIFINNFEYKRLNVKNSFSPAGFANWSDFMGKHTKNIYKDRFCDIYEITY